MNRLQIAALIASGLLANDGFTGKLDAKSIARDALKVADELIEAANAPKPEAAPAPEPAPAAE